MTDQIAHAEYRVKATTPVRSGLPTRVLHTMIRVGNLERSIEFYTEKLGMQLFRRERYPAARFTLAFVGYGDERSSAVIELTHNWDTGAYVHGVDIGHIA